MSHGQSVRFTALVDGDLSGGNPKAIELYVDGTLDLTGYQIGKSSNGGTFSVATGSVLSGSYTDEFLYLSNNQSEFVNVFGTTGDFLNLIILSSVNGNGDDGYQLLDANSILVDQVWTEDTNDSYKDSYFYRNNDTGPDAGWVPSNWSNVGNNATLDGLDAAQHASTIPMGTYVKAAASTTQVSFTSLTATTNENSGTINLELMITNESSTATTVDVGLTSGNAADIGNYTTQTVTFPSNSASKQSVTITIGDDATVEADKVYVFTLANVVGGSSAIIGSPSNFTLTIIDDEKAGLTAQNNPIDCGFFKIQDVNLNSQSDSWSCSSGTYSVNGYVGSSATSDPTETWLVSKVRNYSSASTIILELSTAAGFDNDTKLPTLKISSNYTGDVATATWTDIRTIDNDEGLDVQIDLSSQLSGVSTGVIALKYEADGTSAEEVALSDIELLTDATSGIVVYTWTGSTDSDWFTGSNWSSGSVPTIVYDVVIPSTTTAPVLTGSASIYDLDIASGVVLTVESAASLAIYGSASGAGQVTVKRNTTHSTTDGKYSIIGSPVTSGMTSSLGGIVYKYDETIAYGTDGSTRFTEVTTAESMAAGDAYFSANTGAVSFTGTPNAGTVTQTLVYDETTDGSATNAGFNLVSNPYTAAIDVDALVAGNSDISASVYLWQDESSNTTAGSNDDYVVYNSTTNLSTRTTSGGKDFDGFVRSTQGFFVKATAAASLNFTASMMSTGNNDDAGFYRKANENENFLRLSLNHKESYSDIIVLLRDNAALGFDRLYDAHKIGGSNMSFYSFIDNAKFAIQGLPQLSSEVTVDLGFDVEEAGTYTMNFEEGMFDGRVVYLLDTELNKRINLSEAKSYTFESAQVASSDRFQLVLSSAAILSIDDITASSLNVFTSTSVLNVQTLEAYDNVNIKVLSLNGAVALEARNVDLSTKAWSIPFNKNGLFIIAIETKDGLLVKKFLN